jgi:hypothetical protein
VKAERGWGARLSLERRRMMVSAPEALHSVSKQNCRTSW